MNQLPTIVWALIARAKKVVKVAIHVAAAVVVAVVAAAMKSKQVPHRHARRATRISISHQSPMLLSTTSLLLNPSQMTTTWLPKIAPVGPNHAKAKVKTGGRAVVAVVAVVARRAKKVPKLPAVQHLHAVWIVTIPILIWTMNSLARHLPVQLPLHVVAPSATRDTIPKMMKSTNPWPPSWAKGAMRVKKATLTRKFPPGKIPWEC
ncbi:hypothetical protein ETAA8_58620 [Anatilimnocola aggregata]|uniref:Uncharacterized protein n=1 Tax=Anatilimnocola aggregata TaxID=2528021 RepID=A0A517YKH0_9BACT|nr:hypothetical protein ETAA8_58620 [Anatilimnocola aggregata]